MIYFTLVIFSSVIPIDRASKPQAIVTDVSLSASDIALGQALTITVTGTNNGEDADMQFVSVGFPNLTTTDNIKILKHDFDQTPILIAPGDV